MKRYPMVILLILLGLLFATKQMVQLGALEAVALPLDQPIDVLIDRAFKHSAKASDTRDGWENHGVSYGIYLEASFKNQSAAVRESDTIDPGTRQDWQMLTTEARRATMTRLTSDVTLAGQLLLSKEVWPDPPGSNRELTYTLTLTNVGASPTTGLVITDHVPAGVTYVRGGAEASGFVIWNLPTLGAGGIAQFTYTVYVSDVMNVSIVNDNYEVCSNEVPCVPGDPLTNVAKGPDFETSAVISPSRKKPGSGQPVTPTLAVRNLGPGNALSATALLRYERIAVSSADKITVSSSTGQPKPVPVDASVPDCFDKCIAYAWTGDVESQEIITFTTVEGVNTIGGEEGTPYTATVVITDRLSNQTTAPVTGTAVGLITTLNRIVIRDAPNGGGSEVTTHTMTTDDSFTVYAAGYADDIYSWDVAALWSTTGSLDPISPGPAISTTFSPSTAATSGTISADYYGLGDASGSIVVTGSISPEDSIPPAAITDLAASTGGTAGAVNLRWTAPGDDDNTGTAKTYTLRHNTTEITESNWGASTDVTGEPPPSPAGITESMTVSGLTPGQLYYFAIKTQDEVPNTSQISNSPGATAGEEPTFSISGHVNDVGGGPISGVTVSAGAGIFTITDASGVYTITSLITGTYTLTPSKINYTFTPVSRTVSVPPDATGQNFAGTSIPPSDGHYEPNDTCVDATPIPTDGTVQVHSFHDEEDEDWVYFQATAGITYAIEARTPPTSPADLVIEMYDSCDAADSFDDDDPTFSPDIRISFPAPTSERYYLRLFNNDPAIYGDDVLYHLSVRALQGTQSSGAVIIVAGRLRSGDHLQDNIHYVTDEVYDFARAHGCTEDQVQYLATDTSRDGVTGLPTVANLEDAITNWAKDRVDPFHPLTLYLMDHGTYDLLYLDKPNGQWVTPLDLDGWLDELEANAPDVPINVIVEACYSGSFIDKYKSVSAPGRVVIASTSNEAVAYASDKGAAFSDSFLNSLKMGANLSNAFEEGMWAAVSGHTEQRAWLDDDGDGVANETGEDGDVAAGRSLACEVFAPEKNWAPHIAQVEVRELDSTKGLGEIWVKAQDDQEVQVVWVVIYPPSYQWLQQGEEIIPEPTPLSLVPQKEGWYSSLYPGFTEIGEYRVVAYARDNELRRSRPRELTLTTKWGVFLPLAMRR